ncbi:MAG: ribosomal large subunit methyltransferase [Verrucomicrobiales bacterium]|nr:ribosomal large subunit methyltransferase [Verrucomicrobiales bacterium]
MNWKILAVGRPALPWARQGIDDYLGRCIRYAKVEVEYLRDGPRLQVEERFLKGSGGGVRIVLDERGKRLTTAEWRAKTDQWEMAATKRATFLIGGADGHSAELREAADEVWSLSALTLQHELALVVLLEQIYRVFTIKRGEPYHR